MLKMLIVDDEYLVRKGLQTTIDWTALGIEIIGEASDGEEGLELVKTYHPDIVMTDIKMPIMDGIELMESIRILDINTSILILSGYDEFDFAKKAIENGALAYLLKPVDNDKLCETMRGVVKRIHLQKSTQNYYHQLQEELTSIKRQFILDLLNGRLHDKDKVMEKIKFFELPLDQDHQLVLTLKIDQQTIVEQTLPKEMRQKLIEMIESNISNHLLLSSYYYGIFIKTGDYQWVIILQCLDKSQEEVILNHIRSSGNHFFEQVHSFFPCTYSIGISKFTNSILEVSEQYQYACTASANKLLLDQNSITIYNELLSHELRKEILDSIQYIKGHYSENITIKDVAEALHLSASHLMHLFKAELNVTFNDYLTSYRIKIAEELLNRGEHKIYEVSNMVGYSDVKYFSQLFKKITGFTPREYKKY